MRSPCARRCCCSSCGLGQSRSGRRPQQAAWCSEPCCLRTDACGTIAGRLGTIYKLRVIPGSVSSRRHESRILYDYDALNKSTTATYGMKNSMVSYRKYILYRRTHAVAHAEDIFLLLLERGLGFPFAVTTICNGEVEGSGKEDSPNTDAQQRRMDLGSRYRCIDVRVIMGRKICTHSSRTPARRTVCRLQRSTCREPAL